MRVLYEIEISHNTILSQRQALAKSLLKFSVIRGMPCIGDALAPRIIAKSSDGHRFKNNHSLIAYAGIDAPPYQSRPLMLQKDTFPSMVTVICIKLAMKSCNVVFSTGFL